MRILYPFIYSKYEYYTHSNIQNTNTIPIQIFFCYVVPHSHISLILYLNYRRLCLGNKEVACACRNMA